jgi:hypothetical protein
MKLDSSHRPWAVIIGVLTIICAALYFGAQSPTGRIPILRIPLPEWLLASASPRFTVGAKPLGLIFGTLAFLIFLFAAALGIRKKRRLWRIGNVQTWLKAHIWLTIFTIPLVLFHCGFKLGGPHTSILFWLYVIVMVSGFWGIAMQHFLPRIMMERLPREFVYEQIPNVRATTFEAAINYKRQLEERLKVENAARPAPVAANVAETEMTGRGTRPAVDPSYRVMIDFLNDDALPFLANASASRTRLADPRGADDVLRLLRLNVSDAFRTQVDEIREWCNDHRLMAKQERLHHWLHGWLIIHVPVSFILIVWTAWHIYVTLTYLN